MATVKDLSGNAPASLANVAAMTDQHVGQKGEVHRSYPVTASDTIDITQGITTALSVSTTGAYKITYADGAIDSPYLTAGIWHPMNVRRVWSTGSVATAGISAGY